MSTEAPVGSQAFAHDVGDLDAEELEGIEPEALADRAPDGVRRRTYDKAFEPAVARGLLTVQAAWARGSRDAYAIGLQRRYQLTESLAYEVADNSLTLLEALEILDGHGGGALSELTGTRGGSSWRMVPVALVIAGVLFLVGRSYEQLWEEHGRAAREMEKLAFARMSKPRPDSVRPEPIETRTSSSAPGPLVQRDELGRVTQVSAARPIAVLEEICRLASPSGVCRSLELGHTAPRYPGVWIGRFASGQDGETWAVLIRQNRSSGRWIVGTGLQPIQPIPADDPRLPGLDPVPAMATAQAQVLGR